MIIIVVIISTSIITVAGAASATTNLRTNSSPINDLPRVSTKQKFLLNADDTNILFKNADTKTIIKTFNMEMPKIMEWLKSNKLHINLNKTVVVIFHARQKRVNIDE